MEEFVMKIAIIGMGVAGISVLREWTKEQKRDPSIQITVFGDKETFGTGKAYQSDDAGLLMNQAAEFTSMIPENHYDFVEWMRENYGEEDAASKFYPRAQFGEYVTERMNGWLAQSRAHIIQEKVETIRMLPNDRFRLTWPSQTAEFDAVHLCTGNLPYKDPYDLRDHPNAIGDPFPMDKKLSQIPHGATVGVVGTGLTSIDVFRYTFAHRPDVDVSFLSRSGTFKTIIGNAPSFENRYLTKENIQHAKEKHDGFIPLDTYMEWFEKELEFQLGALERESLDALGSKDSIKRQLAGNRDISTIQTILKNIILLQTDLWMALTETDKQTFLQKYYKQWDKLRAPFPYETGKDFVHAWEENIFRVYEDLADIEKNEESFTCHFKDEEPIHVDYMVNATGNDVNVSFEMDDVPLLRQMLDERLLQPERFGGVQVSVPDLSAISQKYGVLHTLKAHGQLIAGIQFGNSSVRIISRSARASVKDIVKRLKYRTEV